MTKNEVSNYLTFLQKLEELDVAGLLRQSYPEGEFSTISISEFSAAELMATLKRICSNFRAGLNADGMLIPRYAYVNNLGAVDTLNDLQNLIGYTQNRQWPQVENMVNRLVPYLMQLGYWSQGFEQIASEHQTRTEQLLIGTEEQLATLRAAIVTLKKEETALLEQVKASREELAQLTTNAEAVSRDAAEVRQLLSTARTEQNELSSLKTTWSTHSSSAKDAGDTLQSRIDDLEKQTTTLLKAIDGKQEETAKLHSTSKNLLDWIEGKRGDIAKLTGLAADGSLGHSFNERKVALGTAVSRWQWVSVAASVALVAYVFCAYLFIPAPTDPFLAVVTNIGKILPALLVYGFVLRQYSRERSFLEEYEFKAAVALVVNAYADQLAPPKLNEADFKDTKALQEYLRAKEDERRKLISETVTKLFTPPHIHTEKSSNVFTAFRPKAATDMIREAKELIVEARK